MPFSEVARKAAAASAMSQLRNEAAKMDQQWREVLESLAQLQADMADVKQRLAHLESNGEVETR